jgi:hypothetical protein
MIGSVTDLGTAIFEYPTALVQARTDGVRATAEARRLAMLEMAKKVPDLIAADEALLRRAVAHLGHKMIAEQVNSEQVLRHAIEDLRSAPPQEDPGREIDDDWLHSFMNEASTKSAPEMQLLFGKILSGEIKQPGTFSLKAVRTLSMMSQTTAKQFEQLCNVSIAFGGTLMVISHSGDAGKNALAGCGLNFDVLSNLNENDLIYSDFNIKFRAKVISDGAWFDYAGETVCLQTTDVDKRNALHWNGVMLSKIGIELRQIVSMQPDPSYTLHLVNYFEGIGYDLIKATGRLDDGWLTVKRYRDLFPT